MSDIFDASLREATLFYMDAGETPVRDKHTGDFYIPSTMEAVELTLACLEPEQREALVNHALGAGILKVHDLRLDEGVTSMTELRDAMVLSALHKAMRADPEVQARHDSNIRMLDAAFEL